jgi:hypothetical protein
LQYLEGNLLFKVNPAPPDFGHHCITFKVSTKVSSIIISSATSTQVDVVNPYSTTISNNV